MSFCDACLSGCEDCGEPRSSLLRHLVSLDPRYLSDQTMSAKQAEQTADPIRLRLTVLFVPGGPSGLPHRRSNRCHPPPHPRFQAPGNPLFSGLVIRQTGKAARPSHHAGTRSCLRTSRHRPPPAPWGGWCGDGATERSAVCIRTSSTGTTTMTEARGFERCPTRSADD